LTHRLTISIPDELAERLEHVKEGMNVSAVCAEALREAVYKRSRTQENPDAVSRAAERLRGELMILLVNIKATAWEKGSSAVLERLSLREIYLVVNNEDFIRNAQWELDENWIREAVSLAWSPKTDQAYSHRVREHRARSETTLVGYEVIEAILKHTEFMLDERAVDGDWDIPSFFLDALPVALHDYMDGFQAAWEKVEPLLRNAGPGLTPNVPTV